ncbi:hypothetical protein E4U61_005645 [Claviceps capensis]|nr:hypothetical protein E4U61_005645 [Claviceps capensis]
MGKKIERDCATAIETMQTLMLSPIDTFQELFMDTHEEEKMRVVKDVSYSGSLP